MSDETTPRMVDARGHRCPTPSLRLRRALARAPCGAVIVLLADDPLARIDVPHLLAELGDRLIDIETRADGLVFRVQKAPPG